MEDTIVIWAVLLIAGAIALFFIEVMLPSGGLLGLMAATALVTGIVMLFFHNTTTGIVGTIASLIALPFVIGLGFRLLPHSPIFRLMTLDRRQEAIDLSVGRKELDKGCVEVGDRGQALTELRPVGTCSIKGQRVDCLAERGTIQSGTHVRVVWADGMQVKVRAEEA